MIATLSQRTRLALHSVRGILGIGASRLPAVALPWPLRARRAGRRWQRIWGREGLLALVALALCAAFYLAAVVPAEAQRDRAQARVLALRMQAAAPRAASAVAPDTPAEQLVAFYKRFPAQRALPDVLETLVALAERHGVALDEGDYKVGTEGAGKLMRVQMTLPLTGAYPQIRGFLSALPAELPALALENVQFERRKIGDPTVDVKVRIILFLERTR